MTNADIAGVLSKLATMLEIDDANPFRVRAYREAARTVESQAGSVAAMSREEGALEALPGIGKDIAKKIRDIAESGTTPMFDEMKARVPLSVVALTELQGLGPKRVKTLLDVLGVKNHEQLEAAARAGKLRDLPGFGEKVEAKVLHSLATASQTSGRMLLAGAWDAAHAIAARLRAVPDVEQVELAGSFRRRRETIGDLDVLVTGGHPDKVAKAFVSHEDVAEVMGRGETKSTVRLRNGLQVDMRHVPRESFGAALLYFTGSKEHNIELRKIAIEQGLSLNEYGLTRGQRVVAGRTEEEVYVALGLKWIPPELREARGEIERSRYYELPVLLEETDLVADLHMHTDRSDGRDTLETMVRACLERGYRYCAITEHSKSLTVARGFNEARVRKSVAEIEAVRRKVPGIEVLHGLEVDILADGALDLDDDALALLDWVLVSLHSRIDQPGPVVTERVLRALDHPAVSAMAHPSGRLIGTREPAALDWNAVFERARERGVWMEINAQPDRTDLSDVNARLAKEHGIHFVISTDAHATGQLPNIRYGVFAARRAGLTKHDVMNALAPAAFRKALASRRGAAATAKSAPAPAKPAPAPAAAKKKAAAPAPRATPRAKPGARKKSAGAARPAAKKPAGAARATPLRGKKSPRSRGGD